MVLLLSLSQVMVGSYLTLHLLAKDNPKELKYRCLTFLVASLGSVTVSSAIVYLPDFDIMRSFIMTSLSLVAILALSMNRWDVKRACWYFGH